MDRDETCRHAALHEGLDALRRAIAAIAGADLHPAPLAPAGHASAYAGPRLDARVQILLAEATTDASSSSRSGRIAPQAGRPPQEPRVGQQRDGSEGGGPSGGDGDAASSAEDPEVAAFLIRMVEQAREGDPEAFGALFDHYHPKIYRFVYYRTGSVQLAEDLSSEAFVRALRNISKFTWQGKDFGAWLTTIARNLITDHFKSARSRLEHPTEDSWVLDSSTEGPEGAVLASLTNETLLEAVRTLPEEQQTCIVMRFLQGFSIAEVAASLDRSEGAVKQLQLRAIRNLAKRLPEGVR